MPMSQQHPHVPLVEGGGGASQELRLWIWLENRALEPEAK